MHVLGGVEVPKPYQDKDGQILNQEELLTAIGDGLATAVARMQDVQVKSRVIVLLSDGESNTGIIKPEEAVKAATLEGMHEVSEQRGLSVIKEKEHTYFDEFDFVASKQDYIKQLQEQLQQIDDEMNPNGDG